MNKRLILQTILMALALLMPASSLADEASEFTLETDVHVNGIGADGFDVISLRYKNETGRVIAVPKGHLSINNNRFTITVPEQDIYYGDKDKDHFRVSAFTISGKCKPTKDEYEIFCVEYDGDIAFKPNIIVVDQPDTEEKLYSKYVIKKVIYDTKLLERDGSIYDGRDIYDCTLHFEAECYHRYIYTDLHLDDEVKEDFVKSDEYIRISFDASGTTIKSEETTIHEEDNAASDESGLEKAVKYLIPATVAAAVTGVLARRRKKNKEKKERERRQQEEEYYKDDDYEEEEEEEEEEDQLEMEIFKDFGDTLTVGDAAQWVYVCIMRKNSKSPEWTDMDLTRQIKVEGDGYLSVEDGGIKNDWKCVAVSAPECQGEAPAEGYVKFTLANEDGSYVNRIHFKIEKGAILFHPQQTNLTIPARFDEEVKVPFVIDGIDPKADIEVEVTMQDANGAPSEHYDVQLEYADVDKNEPWHAIIRDRLLDKENDMGEAGTYVSYVLHVEARNSVGLVIKGDLPVMRFYMGLSVSIPDGGIGCYLEEYDPVKHLPSTWFKGDDGKQYSYCQTRCFVHIYDYDLENHCMKTIQPNPNPKLYESEGENSSKQDSFIFKVEPVFDKRNISVDESLDAKNAMLEGIDLQLLGSPMGVDNYYYFLSCTKGKLMPPTRLAVKLRLTVKLAKINREYTCEKVVMLWSQPYRRDLTPEAWEAAIKKDDELEDRLLRVRERISYLGLSDDFDKFVDNVASGSSDVKISRQLNFFGVERYQKLESGIDLLLRSRDRRFGYDEETVMGVVNIFNNYLKKCQIENLRQQEEAYKEMADAMKDAGLKEWLHERNKAFDKLNIVENLALGFFTCGIFDVMALAVGVGDAMYEEAEKGSGDYGIGMWAKISVVGAWKATWEFIKEKGMSVLMSTAKGAIIGAKKGWDVTIFNKTKGLNEGKEMVEGGKAWFYEIKKGFCRSTEEVWSDLKMDGGIIGQEMAKIWNKGHKLVTGKEAGGFVGELLKDEIDSATKINRCLKTFTDIGESYINNVNMADNLLHKTKVKIKEMIDAYEEKKGIKKDKPKTPNENVADEVANVFQRSLDDQGGGRYDKALDAAKENARKKIQRVQQLSDDLYDSMRATPEARQEFVKQVLELQRDKHAINLLNHDSVSPKLRAEINTTLMNIHAKVDKNVKRRLSEITGIPEDRILTLNASASGHENLVMGRKVTYDRDITYYYLNDDGIWQYFSQRGTEKLYDLELRRTSLELTGQKELLKNLDGPEAAKYSTEGLDHTNIEDVDFHPESYGEANLNKMIDPYHQREDLVNPEKVADTIMEKGEKEFTKYHQLMDEAEKMMRNASNLDPNIGETIMEEALRKQGVALSHLIEGCRQNVKCFRLLAARLAARSDKLSVRGDLTGGLKVSDKLMKGIALIDKMDKYDASPEAIEVALRYIGYNGFESIGAELANLALAIK